MECINKGLERAYDNNGDKYSNIAVFRNPIDLIRSNPVSAFGGMVVGLFVSAKKVVKFTLKLFVDVIALFLSCCTDASLKEAITTIGLDLEGIARNTIRMIPLAGPFIGEVFDGAMYAIVNLNVPNSNQVDAEDEVDPSKVSAEGSSLIQSLVEQAQNRDYINQVIWKMKDEKVLSEQDVHTVLFDIIKRLRSNRRISVKEGEVDVLFAKAQTNFLSNEDFEQIVQISIAYLDVHLERMRKGSPMFAPAAQRDLEKMSKIYCSLVQTDPTAETILKVYELVLLNVY